MRSPASCHTRRVPGFCRVGGPAPTRKGRTYETHTRPRMPRAWPPPGGAGHADDAAGGGVPLAHAAHAPGHHDHERAHEHGRRPARPAGGTEEKASAPNLLHVVQRVATAYATDLAAACPSRGGTWAFLDRLVAALRAEDDRFGYNCKRGNCADLSEDAVSYYRGPGPPHSSTDVQLFDVISDHCGATSQAQWLDVTGDGRWRYPR